MDPTAQKAKEIFLSLVGKVSPEEWDSHAAQVCAEDESLRQQVLELLHAHRQEDSFLEKPASGVVATVDLPPITEKPGTQIGPYKLLQEIGEGGMGVVYMAEQREPVERRVALKIIKPGMDTRQVIGRFEAERQALAMMDHPNIAKVLDAGTTDSGRPYFVMELVKGTPITNYADEHHLTPQERLELFVPVCQAVQHAHQKGIIHRDIKPSNVLVAEYDDRPVPKIIDFGVAKAIEQRLTEKTMFTHHGQIVGTLEYMSPEQAKLNQLDIDTRSDIYSLGVLLYELLSGETPFDRQRLLSAAFDELLRIIREEEPPRPSIRLSGSQSLPSIAANRQIEPKKLSSLVRGELDWIVMKALEKDRTRRYETASAFAADVRRYLHDEPVHACPPSPWYRVRKFSRRHKAGMIMGTILLVTVLGATVGQLVSLTVINARTREALENNRQRLAALERESRARERVATISVYQMMALAHYQWQEGDVGQADQLLDEVPPVDHDWVWRLLKRTCHSESARFSVPDYRRECCSFSGDGRRLALVDHTGILGVWDVSTGRRIATFTPDKTPCALAVDRGGETVAIGTRGGDVHLHDAETGRMLYRLPRRKTEIRRLAFSAVNGRLAVSTKSDVSVWDYKERKQLIDLEAKDAGTVAFSPDGQLFAAIDDGVLTVRNVAGGEPLYQTDGVGRASPVVFGPANARLACAEDESGAIRIVDFEEQKVLHRLVGHLGRVRGLSFRPDGAWLCSGGEDTQIRIWDVQAGVKVRTILGPTARITDVAFDETGERLHTVDESRRVKTWDPSQAQPARRFPFTAPWHATFSPDGRYLAVGALDTSVHVVALETGLTVLSESVKDDLPWAVAFSPDGKTLAAASEAKGTIYLWDLATGRLRGTLPAAGRDWPNLTIAYSPDGKRLAAGGLGRRVCVWNVETGQKLFELGGHSQAVSKVIFSRDGKLLVSGSGGMRHTVPRQAPDGSPLPIDPPKGAGDIKVWDALTGKLLNSIDGLFDKTEGLAISADASMIAATFWDGSVRLYDVASGELVRRLGGHFPGAWTAAYHPIDSRCLVTGDNAGNVVVWDAQMGQEIISLGRQSCIITAIEFSADGTKLLTVDTDCVKVWDATPLKNTE